MEIQGRPINDAQPCFVIAELGINHNGDFEIAKRLIESVSNAGADAVKLQRRTLPDSIPGHMRDVERDTPWGRLSYLDYKRKLEFSPEQYQELADIAHNLGLFFGVSVWDVTSAKEELDVDFLKIPSAHMSNDAIVEAVVSRGLPFFWSTGMHDSWDVQRRAKSLSSVGNWGVMHCNSTYPSPVNELNLRVISVWKRFVEFLWRPIGYSGHEVGLATTVAAVALGANIVERHITLDRSMWGSDQAASVEPQGFLKLVKDIRSVEAAIGNGVKVINDSELEKRAALSLT